MVPSESDIIKFKKLYKERFGIELSEKDAFQKGAKLLRLLQLSYKPMTVEHVKVIQKRKKYIFQKK